ncbi:MAG: hypothetical protein ACPGUC_10160, partial [Gammaproteobacteria bacterium]
PENVVKKLKTLKKQKTDEADARKRAEADARKQRKEKQDNEKKIEELKAVLKQANEQLDVLRKLHEQASAQREQLVGLVDDAEGLDEIPALDETVLDAIAEAAGADSES